MNSLGSCFDSIVKHSFFQWKQHSKKSTYAGPCWKPSPSPEVSGASTCCTSTSKLSASQIVLWSEEARSSFLIFPFESKLA